MCDAYTDSVTASSMISKQDVPLVECMYLVFTRMPGERYRRRLRSLRLSCLCDVFQALIIFLVCCFCTSGVLGLVPFEITIPKRKAWCAGTNRVKAGSGHTAHGAESDGIGDINNQSHNIPITSHIIYQQSVTYINSRIIRK